jgi:hypothetical protein
MKKLFVAGCVVASTAETSHCGMYLAPSTIPGAGLGIFAGDHPIARGEALGMGDIVIPIVDFHWHNGGKNNTAYPFLWLEYTWNAGGFPHLGTGEIYDVKKIDAASPGFGAAANCIQKSDNVDDVDAKISRAMEGTSPSVGAISPHYGRYWKATTDIPPGAEIFIE